MIEIIIWSTPVLILLVGLYLSHKKKEWVMIDTRIFENRAAVLNDLEWAWIMPNCLKAMINTCDNSLHLYVYRGMDRAESHSIEIYGLQV